MTDALPIWALHTVDDLVDDMMNRYRFKKAWDHMDDAGRAAMRDSWGGVIVRHAPSPESVPVAVPKPVSRPTEMWARVDIRGHRHHYGRVAEALVYGITMLQIDQPTEAMDVFDRLFFAQMAIFSIEILSEEDCRAGVARKRERIRAAAALETALAANVEADAVPVAAEA